MEVNTESIDISLNKEELYQIVSDKTKISKKEVSLILEDFFEYFLKKFKLT